MILRTNRDSRRAHLGFPGCVAAKLSWGQLVQTIIWRLNTSCFRFTRSWGAESGSQFGSWVLLASTPTYFYLPFPLLNTASKLLWLPTCSDVGRIRGQLRAQNVLDQISCKDDDMYSSYTPYRLTLSRILDFNTSKLQVALHKCRGIEKHPLRLARNRPIYAVLTLASVSNLMFQIPPKFHVFGFG